MADLNIMDRSTEKGAKSDYNVKNQTAYVVKQLRWSNSSVDQTAQVVKQLRLKEVCELLRIACTTKKCVRY